MKITWYGHSCFLLDDGRTRLLTDPYDPETIVTPLHVKADIVTLSHSHHDHSYLAAIDGEGFLVARESAQFEELSLTAIPSFHDGEGGAKRGLNTIFRIEMGGLVIAHLGDLGHPLTAGELEALGRVDVLLLPVGGVYTIDAQEARQVAEAVGAPAVIPMHYYIPTLKFALGDVEDFIDCMEENWEVGFLPGNTAELTPETLPGKSVLIFDYLDAMPH